MITRRQFAAAIPVAAASLGMLALTGCGDDGASGTAGGGTSGTPTVSEPEPPEPLDLTGTWRQVNSNSEETWQEATIADGVISIDWIMADGTRAIYWVGSYVAPTGPAETYSWDSARDVEQTEAAILASQSDSKTFTYEGGRLKWDASAMGVTTVVECERQE